MILCFTYVILYQAQDVVCITEGIQDFYSMLISISYRDGNI